MNLPKNSEPEYGVPISGGQFEFLQQSTSTTDSTVATVGTDSASETPLAGGSLTTSVHAVFNLDTKKVMDAIKETRETLDKKCPTSKQRQHSINSKPKKPKKKISASWKAEWSEDSYKKHEPNIGENFVLNFV